MLKQKVQIVTKMLINMSHFALQVIQRMCKKPVNYMSTVILKHSYSYFVITFISKHIQNTSIFV